MKMFFVIFFSVISFIAVVLTSLTISLIFFLISILLRDPLAKKASFNMLIAVDQFANTVILGDVDETISSRTGRAILSGKAKWFVKYLQFFIDKIFNVIDGQRNHCINAVEHGKTFKNIWKWIKD